MQKLLILTEAGDGIGWGHLMRMRSLAAAAQKIGLQVTTALEVIGEVIELESHESCVPWWQDSEWAKTLAPDLILIDSYRASSELLQAYHQHFRVAVIDDYQRLIPYPAEIIINPNLCADLIDYQKQTAQLIGGAGFQLLRSEFEADWQFEVRPQLSRILLMAGGSDQTELLPLLLGAFASDSYLEVIVVAGHSDYQQSLRHQFPAAHVYARLNPSDLIQMMLSSDLLITAAGQTLHESACLGLPTLGIVVAPDQDLHLQACVKAGWLPVYLHREQDELIEQLKQTIHDLNFERRQTMSQRGRQLIQTGGAERILSAIMSALNKRP